MNTVFENIQCLDNITVELYDSEDSLISGFNKTIPAEELVYWDYNIRIDLPTISSYHARIPTG